MDVADDVYESRWGVVHYDKRGWGDPLLLVHGLYVGASREEFFRNISALAGQFTVYAIDLLGFGDSDAPKRTYTAELYHHLLRDFIIEVIGRRAHLVASGLSAGFAVRLGVYNEEAVDRMTLICPEDHPQANDRPGNMRKLQQFFLGTLNAGASLYETVATPLTLFQFLQSRYAKPRRATRERLDQMTHNASRVNSMYPYISLLTGYMETDTFRWMRYVRSPVQVIWGDALGDPPHERIFRPAAWSQGKRLDLIEDAAHWPHDEQSAAFNRLVTTFLSDTRTGE